jgi:hypothetical protein
MGTERTTDLAADGAVTNGGEPCDRLREPDRDLRRDRDKVFLRAFHL